MEFKDFIVKNYPTGITKLTLNRLDSCWQAARTSQQKERHTPGCLAGEERRKNLMRWEPFPDCTCRKD